MPKHKAKVFSSSPGTMAETTKHGIFLFILSLCFFCGAAVRADESLPFPSPRTAGIRSNDPIPRLTWAHYVGWGFPFEKQYDTPDSVLMRLYDRPLLGDGWAGSDHGASSTTRNEIVSALEHGIDGFTVDVPPSASYAGSMSRFYRAAEGLPFYVSLCVDGWDAGPMETIVEHLTAYFEQWGDHPNNFYIDGKPVVFIYSTRGKTPDDYEAILRQLREKGHEAFWLVQPLGESHGWNDEKNLARSLEIFDGFYDFGSTGMSLDWMKKKLDNGRNALKTADRPGGGLLVGSITQGYSGGHNAFYRPFFGTGTLRNSWEAVLDTRCDWVCVTTWNDYWESTQFGPSDWTREALLRINREYVRRWKGERPPPRPPQVFISYKNEVRLGDDWTLEVLAFPYSTPQSECRTRLLDFEGNPIRVFEAVPLDKDDLTVSVHRLKLPGFDGPRIWRLQAAVVESGGTPEETDWKELYPMVVRPGIRNPKFVRQRSAATNSTVFRFRLTTIRRNRKTFSVGMSQPSEAENGARPIPKRYRKSSRFPVRHPMGNRLDTFLSTAKRAGSCSRSLRFRRTFLASEPGFDRVNTRRTVIFFPIKTTPWPWEFVRMERSSSNEVKSGLSETGPSP